MSLSSFNLYAGGGHMMGPGSLAIDGCIHAGAVTGPIRHRDTSALQAAVTTKIIALLESGHAPWQRPWNDTSGLPPWPRSAISKRPYRGVNFLNLLTSGFSDPRWCTIKQASARKWQIPVNTPPTLVWFSMKITTQAPQLAAGSRTFPLRRCSQVYNLSQLEGIPALDPRPRFPEGWSPTSEAARIIEASGARIEHGADRACYIPVSDAIHLPTPGAFRSESHYYAAALHELAHWTGHPARLNRKFGIYGDETYAREELRAELASAMLSVRLGVPHDPSTHASYIGSWIEVLKRDQREIFHAASAAQKIVDLLCG